MTDPRAKLATRLRALILETACELENVGVIEESLKWGQPSFTPKKRKVGSSVRLQNNEDGSVSLMFICNTNLVERFRGLYSDDLQLIGNREIRIANLDETPQDALKHCIKMAMTYHLTK